MSGVRMGRDGPGSDAARVPVVAYEAAQGWLGRDDLVASEEPLEIRVDTRAVSVTMRTPGHDEELAAGFLLTEGVIASGQDIVRFLRHPRNEHGSVIDVQLGPDVRADLARLTRHVFAGSSCGLCGKAAIEAVRCMHAPLGVESWEVAPGWLTGLPSRMREAQRGFEATGGIHAAALFDAGGELVVLREDVGRHNAVDKVVGHRALAGALPLGRSVLLVSGRLSFEIMQKALAGGIPMVAAVSAPSALAVGFAAEAGQTLVGFLRDGRFNVYAGGWRIQGCAGVAPG